MDSKGESFTKPEAIVEEDTPPPPSLYPNGAPRFDPDTARHLLNEFEGIVKQEFVETKTAVRRVLKELVGYQKDVAALKAQLEPLLEREAQEEQRIQTIETEALDQFRQCFPPMG